KVRIDVMRESPVFLHLCGDRRRERGYPAGAVVPPLKAGAAKPIRAGNHCRRTRNLLRAPLIGPSTVDGMPHSHPARDDAGTNQTDQVVALTTSGEWRYA